jgi:hypothetical protein
MSETDNSIKKFITSENRIYEMKYMGGGKEHKINVYDAKTKRFLRTESFKKARSQWKFINMNKVIKNISIKEKIPFRAARDKYFIKRGEIEQGRIRNIATAHNLSLVRARDFYNTLVSKGEWNKLKQYS